MKNKDIDWRTEQRFVRDVAAGPWTEWLRTARKPKDIVANEIEVKLATRLGLPFVPKKGGILSFGWVVSKMVDMAHAHHIPNNDPLVLALNQLGNAAMRRIPSIPHLVLNLMSHREMITKHQHNLFHYGGHAEAIEGRLYADWWTPLNQEVLDWAMLQSPLSELSTCHDRDEYFTEVHIENGRLHNTQGKAIVTTKNRGLYAIRGVILSAEQFRLRGDARNILRVQNVEARRVLVEDMGPDVFIQRAGLKAVHEDKSGKLYRLLDETTARRHLAWVHVVCPSTMREYMLAVPPNTRTAQEGVAWTFRKLPEEYSPMEET